MEDQTKCDDDARVSSGLVDCYFGGQRRGGQLLKHQLDSFNDFVSRKLEQIIEGFNTVDVCNTFLPEHGCYLYMLSLSLLNPTLSKPVIHEKDGSTKGMLPNDARLRNLTYAAPLMIDLNVTAKVFMPELGTYKCDTKRINSVNLGRIPIMVQSRYCTLGSATPAGSASGYDECPCDFGGYFIINGSEKVLISQDRISENVTYVFMNNKASYYSLVAEIRSVQEARFGVPKTLTLKLSSRAGAHGHCIKLCMHHIKHDVPVFLMFRALGIESDVDITRCIVQNAPSAVAERLIEELAGCMDDGAAVCTKQAALEYLAKHLTLPHQQPGQAPDAQRQMTTLCNVLRKDMLPHVGHDPMAKALYIGYMVSRLLCCHIGLTPLDDRDSYVNKRLDTPGVLMANLFRQYYGKVIKDMRALVQKDINNGSWRATKQFINVVTHANVYKLIKQTIIESGLKYGLATGNWGVKTTSRMRQGVAQVLNRMTYSASLSHCRRVNTPIEKTGKLVQPRKLHPTQWGIICPSETPEGASVGLVKNLALLANITIAMPSEPVLEILPTLGVVMIAQGATLSQDAAASMLCPARVGRASSSASVIMSRVIMNGAIIGVHSSPADLVQRLKELKRTGVISVFTSIVWRVSVNEVSICTEGGRFVRPVLVIGPDRKLVLDCDRNASLRAECIHGRADWHDIVLSGCVEYIDVEEASMSVIAMTPAVLRRDGRSKAFTHVEVSPSAMLGVVAGSIPFSDHNQAPRNTYQSAMGKQAIGIYSTNFRHRFDTMVHVLSYPQRPLVSTHTARIINCDKLPCGVNAIVAIACFTGFNQEDSVIINKSAVDKGMLGSTFYRTFREQNNKNHSTGEEEYFCLPDPATTRNMKPCNYSKLQESGFVAENTYVEPGDIIIGKCMPHKTGQTISNKDTSVALKSNERGFVDRNCYGNRHFTNTTCDGYTFAKCRLRQERVPTIGDKVSCYTADHDVLTELHGWVPIAKLDASMHRVASLMHDGSVEYQTPSEVQKFKGGGVYLVSVRGNGVDLLVTPEHRMWVRRDACDYGAELAADLAEWGTLVHLLKTLPMPSLPRIDDPEMQRRCRSSGHAMHILGKIIGCAAAEGAKDIRLPPWMLSLNCPVRLSMLFFSGLFPTSSSLLRTRSASLIDHLQQLALHTGIAINTIGEKDGWYLAMQVAIAEPLVKHTYIPLSCVPAPDVFCCTVPRGPGVIYVRRNGMPVWCGNSRHGQKGTIGMLYREEDMPFTSGGLIPSLIINPHAIPSRMTIGQLMEALECKACGLNGLTGDATPFNGRTVEDIAAELEAAGAERYGNEIMYNPRSGEQIACAVFVCPTYYQRLKHMVEDKVHSRAANGPVVVLTHQPAEGRARDGGLRVGEMELECLWAHGNMFFLKERFMECSDNYRVFVCRKCRMIAVVNPERNIYACKACKNNTEFAEVRVPYACKLLMQEVQTMSIGTYIST